MKRVFFTAFFCLLFAVCFPQYSPSAQVQYKSQTDAGTITLSTAVFGKETDDRENEAVSSALYTLIFTGVPGSKYDLPLVPDATLRNNTAVKKLLGEGRNEFLILKQLISEDEKISKKKNIQGKNALYEITVNYNALRRYLEQNNVIRKFGI